MTEIIFIKPSEPRSEYSMTALKPAYVNQSDTISSIQNHFKDNKDKYRFAHHPARCQAINRIKQLGWIMSTDVEVRGDQPCSDSMQIFLDRYNMSDEYNIVKFNSAKLGSETLWGVYIPSGYNLIQIPTLYHTGRWYSFPGVLDGDEGIHFLNTFIIMKKDDVIPVNTPLFQCYLQKKEPQVKATYRELSDDDRVGMMFKHKLVSDETNNDYHLAKKQGLFYNPLYEE